MPFGAVQLIPGVNVERTPTLLRTGISQSQFIRFKDSLTQKYGGFQKFFPFSVSGVPRDLHAWQQLSGIKNLAVATTTQLSVIAEGVQFDVSPQVFVSETVPNISTTAGSSIVSIVDPNISNVTVLDSVFFNVPVSQGGIILDGFYPIVQITGVNSYQIDAGDLATTTTLNPTPTNAVTAAGNNTLHFASTPSWVVAGMTVYDITTPGAIPASTTVTATTLTTVVMSKNATGPGVGSGDNIVFSSVPVFNTVTGSSEITTNFISHGLNPGDTVNFTKTTTANGVDIENGYTVNTVPNPNTFTFTAYEQATVTGAFAQNGGNVEILYFIAIGPPPLGAGYGLGGYGLGGYGTGTSTGSNQGGTDLAANDWTLDNWGELLISCPENGAIFFWGPVSGVQNSQVITQAPPFNTGIFISMSQQILVAFGSSIHVGIGWQQQPLLVQWSDVSNFFQWTPSASTQAGNFTIPNGSAIIGGMAVSNQNLLWTDLDLWAMSYIGPPLVFSFNKIGAGAGLISKHAAQQLRGSVYWMGPTNFYNYTSGGANVIPCPVWDAVFQNLNTAFSQNVRAMPNTPFNEVGWLYPSLASTNGECDSYVKFNITEPGAPWDYGLIARSAWIDQSTLGMPIAASPGGLIFQHETTPDADGNPLVATFTTGEFYLVEGEEFVFVDQIIPDFKYTTFPGGASANIQMTFNVSNFPGDTPISFGPFTVTQATQFISLRLRGRLMSITMSSSDLGSFWRIGSIKYRYAPAGRR